MQNSSNIEIQEVSNENIKLSVNGETTTILKKLEALQQLLEQQQSKYFQRADKIYNIGSINNANFGFLLDQVSAKVNFPEELAGRFITEENQWIKSLEQALKKQGVSVGKEVSSIFQHYGWMIEIYLRKMNTPIGKKKTLRRVSFLTEVYQNSLRYLCFIQLAKLLERQDLKGDKTIAQFFQLNTSTYPNLDLVSFLSAITDLVATGESFMPEITQLVEEIFDKDETLYEDVQFLENVRSQLIQGKITAQDDLDALLDNLLAALVFWLRKLSFLAKYRLVSIKDINVNYSVGMTKCFVHAFGELHGLYDRNETEINELTVEKHFTYNHSVLLFKGNHIDNCLRNIEDASTYLSLSPMIIDQSVFATKSTQTPEIYYYIGREKSQYYFSHYQNELFIEGQTKKKSNKQLCVKGQNNEQPKLDPLHEQIKRIIKPYKASV